MPTITFNETPIEASDGESVLECLERAGHEIPNSCRSGVCHSCMLQATAGDVPAKAQSGLKESLRAQGYFLSCSCLPESDLEVVRGGEVMQRVPARVESTEPLNDRVIRVRMTAEAPLTYFPGQFVNFVREDGLLRSFSLASVPGLDACLEFHVALVPDGKMSGWLHREASPGTTLELQGPLGNCFYTGGKPDQPIMLLGTGTGLAPLYGILRDALQQGHTGPIQLFHGALKTDDLYLTGDLRALDAAHDNFAYHPCIREESGPDWAHQADVADHALQTAGDLKGWKVYLCGNPDLVKQVQRKVFMAGASMQDIYADAFLPAAGG